MTDLQRLQWEIGRWSDRQFGSSFSDGDDAAIPTLNHLDRELIELRDKLGADDEQEEWADVLMLVLDASRRRGFFIEDLIDVTWDKLDVNRRRKWGEPDADGVVEHIKEAPADA